MTRSTLSVEKALSDKDHAIGYDPTTLKPLVWRDIAITAPAGAINSSVREMAKWVEAWLKQGQPLLSEASYAAMTTKQMTIAPTVDYGYGWFLRKWKGGAVVEHGGNIDGFNAEVAFIPENFKATFDTKGMLFEQPGIKLALVKEKASTYKAPLSVDALLEKMLAATGGKEAWSKHKSRVAQLAVDFENQGMQATGEEYYARGQKAIRLNLTAIQKKIGWMASGYNGKFEWVRMSFIPALPNDPGERARAEADFSQGLLDPRALFAKMEITGTTRIGEEECYLLVKTTKSGERMTESVSTTRFLVLQRDTNVVRLYSDFKQSGGVVLAHTTVENNPSMGAIVTTVKSIRWDVPVDDTVFAVPK